MHTSAIPPNPLCETVIWFRMANSYKGRQAERSESEVEDKAAFAPIDLRGYIYTMLQE